MTDHETNEAVARKLGYPIMDGGSNSAVICSNFDKDVPVCSIPDYCHSIEAAWEIWDHFNEMATLTKHNGEWILDYGRRFVIKSTTAPRAICLAFLELP